MPVWAIIILSFLHARLVEKLLMQKLSLCFYYNVDIIACWWTADRTQSIVVWKIVHFCLLWCLWRERNDRNFEDCERTLEELESFFSHTLVSLVSCIYFSLVAELS
jgi:uncharacterized membrane protein YqjE